MHKLITFGAAAALLALTALPAAAQTAPTVNKTWVSSTGSDTGSCQLVAPCKTFAYAISETNAGGEIDVKDSGAYGAFTIDKAITIVADGVVASVGIGVGAHAINITAGSSDTVDISGLTINTHNLNNAHGIDVNCQCHVTLDHVILQGNEVGVFASGAFIMITNSHIASNLYGIFNNGNDAAIYVGQDNITGNRVGIYGNISSYHNNEINGNRDVDLENCIVNSVGPE